MCDYFYKCASVKTAMGSYWWSLHKCAKLLFCLLATLEFAHGYSTVSMGRLCSKRGGTMALHPGSAVSIVLDHFNTTTPCAVEVTSPPSYHISMVFNGRHRQEDRLPSDINTVEKQCPFSVTYPGRVEQVARVLDLCSPSSLEEMKYTELFANHIILEWQPTQDTKPDNVLALEVILASVGRGREVCTRPDMFPCLARPPFSVDCVGLELVCDGRRNCPYSGNDEDPVLCDSDRFSRLTPGKLPLPQDSFHFGQGLQFIASEMIKKLIDSKNTPRNTGESEVSTEKTTVLWFDEENGKTRRDSLPNVLNHYGPWGYLMLGMLICGTVLMFCGLWECCCRRPKAATSSSGPTLLIINQGAQGAEGLEVPATPNPPRYEDLDQPPSYTTLFPSSKTNQSLQEAPSLESPSSSQSNVDTSPRIFTIDCPIPDTRPKTSQS